MGEGEQKEKQYFGYTHKELTEMSECQRDAIIRRRVQEDFNKMTDGTSNDKHTTNQNFGYARKKEDCFVASAVYGGIDVKQVRVLREYRDNVLMQEDFGREFVDWYYREGGERIASFIDRRARFLIPIIRKGLDLLVKDYQSRKDF